MTAPWTAHWLQQKPGGVYAYDVMTRLSTDGGRTLERAAFTARRWHGHGARLRLDREPRRPSVRRLARRAQDRWAKATITARTITLRPHGAMTLRGAVLTPAGAIDGSEIDARVCDCCQTDVAVSGAALLVVYRNRSEDETRDIQAARLERRRLDDAGHRACRRLAHRRVPGQRARRGGAR